MLRILKQRRNPQGRTQAIDGRNGRPRNNSNHADKYSKQYKNANVKCFRCGKDHLTNKCNLNRSVRCYSYGKLGHLRAVCFKNTSSTNNLAEMLSLEHSNYRDKFLLSVEIEGKEVEFELDSEAAVTVMSKSEATKLFPTTTIRHTDLRLISFCGRVLRCCDVAPLASPSQGQ